MNKILYKLFILLCLIFMLSACSNDIKVEKNIKIEENTNQNQNQDQDQKIEEPEPEKKIDTKDFSEWNRTCDEKLIVINKDNPMPQKRELTYMLYKGEKINQSMRYDLDKLLNDSKKDGVNIFLYSVFRTIDLQDTYFRNETKMFENQGFSHDDAVIKASSLVAPPGCSEHHTGLAIDFNCADDSFINTKEYEWLVNNAHNYGFILRYSKEKTDVTKISYEPWHFRYVGVDVAKKIKASGMCLEEYIASIR